MKRWSSLFDKLEFCSQILDEADAIARELKVISRQAGWSAGRWDSAAVLGELPRSGTSRSKSCLSAGSRN
jgi:hypothetical protein